MPVAPLSTHVSCARVDLREREEEVTLAEQVDVAREEMKNEFHWKRQQAAKGLNTKAAAPEKPKEPGMMGWREHMNML